VAEQLFHQQQVRGLNRCVGSLDITIFKACVSRSF
jgi:hypothetical protein